jgi:hypothetical protein
MKLKHIILFLAITMAFGSCKKEEQEPTLTTDFNLVLVGGGENTTVTKLGIAELSFLFYKKGELLIEEDGNNSLFMGTEILENTTGVDAFSIIQNYKVRDSLNIYCEMPNSKGHLKVRFYMMVNNIERGNSIVVDFTVTDTSINRRAIQMSPVNNLIKGNNGSVLAIGLIGYYYTSNNFNTFEKVTLPELLNPGVVDANGHFILFKNNILFDFNPNTKSFTSRNMPFTISFINIFDGVYYFGTSNNEIMVEKTPGVFTPLNALFLGLNKLMKSANGKFFALITPTNSGTKLYSLDSDTSSSLTPINISGIGFLYDVELYNDKLYAFTQEGLFVSTNLGDSWSKLGNLPNGNARAHDYAVSNNKIYVSYGELGGLYYSSNVDAPVFKKLPGTPFDYRYYPLSSNELLISRRSNVQLIVPTP